MAANVYSVSQVNSYIGKMFSQDFFLSKVRVSGEVSNCTYHRSGHIYFSLKDRTAAIACVMFAGDRRGLAFSMKDGDQVVVGGSIRTYERDGRYQLYAKEIILSGVGLLYERFQALKKELEEMGMFDLSYKQEIPRGIRRLGVVTAPTGAAFRDICKVAKRRNPGIQIILCPALVQGEGAKESIVRAIKILEKSGVETIIVGRGGGSIEDLWAFNEEEVAKAIFNCPVPIISAVGHETDTTIADFVADLRAPTPSAAAELAVLDMESMANAYWEYKSRLRHLMGQRLQLDKQKLEQYRNSLRYLSPKQQIRDKRLFLADLETRLGDGMDRSLDLHRHQLHIYIEKLKGLSPLDKLSQGYSFSENGLGQAVKSIKDVHLDDLVRIHVKDGKILARVEKTVGV